MNSEIIYSLEFILHSFWLVLYGEWDIVPLLIVFEKYEKKIENRFRKSEKSKIKEEKEEELSGALGQE